MTEEEEEEDDDDEGPLTVLVHTWEGSSAVQRQFQGSKGKRILTVSKMKALIVLCTLWTGASLSVSHPRACRGLSPRARGVARATDDDGWSDPSEEQDAVVARAAAERRAMALEEVKAQAQSPAPPPPMPGQEPDLFVPAMVVVSSTGFFGFYAFETLRLYQAGELWLPFLGNVQPN